MPDTITVDPSLTRDLLDDVLDHDAASHTDAEAPPRVPWLNEDGTPRWGVKADGTPRKSNPGSGRPPKNGDSKPRATGQAPADEPRKPHASAEPADEKDYTEDIGAALTMVWMGTAAIPWTRGHAAVLRAQTPVMAPAWNQAAQQNATIRKYVKKLSGEGSWSWVLPVTIVTTPLLIGFWQVTVNSDLRASLAAQTDKDFQEFLQEQARAAGMTVPDSPSGSPDQTDSESPETSPTD